MAGEQEEQEEKEVEEESTSEEESSEEESEEESSEEEEASEEEASEDGEEEEEDEEDPLEALRMENATLRGQVQQISEQLNSRRGEREEEEEEETDPISIVTADALRKDPVGTIRKALQLQDLKTRKEVAISNNRTQRSIVDKQREDTLIAREFPDIYEDQELNNFAGRLYRESIQDAGVDFPGARYLAAAAAKYLILKHRGKITAGKAVPSLKERVRQASNPKINGKETASKDGGKKDPLHGLTPKQRRAAEKVAKGFGLSLAQWRKAYDEGSLEEEEDV